MGAALQYDISVIGLRNIDAAFAHVEQRARRANRAMMLGAQQAQTRMGGAAMAARSGSGKAAIRAAAMSEEAVKAEVTKRGNALKEKLAARTAARIAKIEAQFAAKGAAEKAALERRAEAARLQHTQRLARIEAASKARMAAASAKEEARVALREHTRAGRLAERVEREKLGKLRAVNAAAAAGRAKFGTAVGTAAMSSVTSIGRSAVNAAALGGTALVGISVAKQLGSEKAAASLANKAYGIPGETRSREEIKGDLMATATGIGKKTGDRAGVIEAIDKFVAISGSLKGGENLAQFMADMADATGANMGDIGRTGGQILQNIVATKNRDLANPEDFKRSMEDVREIMAAMGGQAKIGSIEFTDLAQQMGKVMSSTSRFKGDVSDLANQMGAISQLAIAGGASSPEEAMTAIMRFADDLVQNAGKFNALAASTGMKGSFFTDSGNTKLRDPTEIMMDILRVTKGDLTKTKEIFGIRAMKAVEPFQQAYVSAKEGGATEEEAIANVQKTIDRFKGAKMSVKEVGESAAFARSQSGRQVQIAWEDLTVTMGEQLIPAIRDLVPELKAFLGSIKEMTPAIKSVISFLVNNPFSGLGLIIAGKVTADIGKAAIGEAISQSITKSAGAGLGLKIGTATLAIAAATLIVEKISNSRDEGVNRGVAADINRQNIINKASATMRGGKALSAEQRTAIESQIANIQQLKGEAASKGITGGPQGKGPGMVDISGPSGGDLARGLWGDLTNYMGITDAGETKGSAEVYQHAREVEKAGKGELDKELVRLTALLTAAGKDLKDGSAALKEAAKGGINRGNAPSPVK